MQNTETGSWPNKTQAFLTRSPSCKFKNSNRGQNAGSEKRQASKKHKKQAGVNWSTEELQKHKN